MLGSRDFNGPRAAARCFPYPHRTCAEWMGHAKPEMAPPPLEKWVWAKWPQGWFHSRLRTSGWQIRAAGRHSYSAGSPDEWRLLTEELLMEAA